MKTIRTVGLFLTLGTLAAGCSTAEGDKYRAQRQENATYQTGSRIPTNTGGSGSVSAVSQEGYKEAVREAAGSRPGRGN